MSFDWSEYLNVARELAGEKTTTPSEEAKLRAAISRAYYAAFNKARWYLRYKDYDRNIPQEGTAHEYVKNKFRSHPDEQYKKVGSALHRLHIFRRKADYDDVYTDVAYQAKIGLQLAADVISTLDKF